MIADENGAGIIDDHQVPKIPPKQHPVARYSDSPDHASPSYRDFANEISAIALGILFRDRGGLIGKSGSLLLVVPYDDPESGHATRPVEVRPRRFETRSLWSDSPFPKPTPRFLPPRETDGRACSCRAKFGVRNRVRVDREDGIGPLALS